MKPKLTEVEKLKYWLDGELTTLHVMFAIIMLQLTQGTVPTVAFSIYLVVSVVYAVIRFSYMQRIDKDYLKIPKNEY